MNLPSKRWTTLVLVAALATAVTVTVPVPRRKILRAAGWALVASESSDRVDIVVISIDAEGAGALEAADLVHAGVAKKVAVFVDAPDRIRREFVRRGVAYAEDLSSQTIRELKALGVGDIEMIPNAVSGTEDEGPVLADWCDRKAFGAVMIVSTVDHSRRLRRVLRRSMRGHPTRIVVRAARYTDFDPNRWWESRSGVRTEMEEAEKLLLDVMRYPIS